MEIHMKYKIIFLVVIIVALFAQGQEAIAQLRGEDRIDSLLAELPRAKKDTNHAKLLGQISWEHYASNPDKGIEYGLQGVEMAKELNWKKGESFCYNSLGVNYSFGKSDDTKALEYYLLALKINEEISNTDRIAANLSNIGIIYQNLSDYPKALEYYFKALKLDSELGSKSGIAITFGNIGTIYQSLSDYPKALEYYHKALKMDEELGNSNGVARHFGNIGIIYQKQNEFTKALEYYHKALDIFKEIGNKRGLALNLSNIGNIYKKQDQGDKALKYYYESLKIKENLGNLIGIASTLGNIGITYQNKSQYSKALEYYHKALKIEKGLENKLGTASILGSIGDLYQELSLLSPNQAHSQARKLPSLSKENYLDSSIVYSASAVSTLEEIGELHLRSIFLNNLADAFVQKANFELALKYRDEYTLLKDSVFNEEKFNDLRKLESERNLIIMERDKTEALRIKTEQNRQRNTLQYLSIGFVVVLLGVLLLLSGRLHMKEWMARALVFLTFIFTFEFILVMIDPWTDDYSEGIPFIKFAINMSLALIIFPMHQYFEKRVSLKIVKPDELSIENVLADFREKKQEKKSNK